MPTKKQLSKVWEQENEFPETRRDYDPQYKSPAIPKQKVNDTELWNEVLNALGYGFVNREKFIKEAQQRYTITRKNNQ